MVKRKSKRKLEERPNPFAKLSDEDLGRRYSEALGAYIERMGYFDALPSFLYDDFKQVHEQGPGAWGLTGSEWEGYVLDLRDHLVATYELDDMRSERARRLSDAARQAVESCGGLDDAQAKRALYGIPQGPLCPWKTEAESMEGYVLRMERHHDGLAEWLGANRGLDAFFDRWLDERANRHNKRRMLL